MLSYGRTRTRKLTFGRATSITANTKHGAYACRSAADSGGYHLAGSKGASKSTGSMPSAMTSSSLPMASATPSGQHHHGKHHQKSGEMASPTPLPTAT